MTARCNPLTHSAVAVCAVFLLAPLQAAARPCAHPPAALDAAQRSAAGISLPLFRQLCYEDTAGTHVVLLTESQDRPHREELLSSRIQAFGLRRTATGQLEPEWKIQDFAGPDDAGLNFRSRRVVLEDIDKDGLVEPLLVYRFFALEDGVLNTDAYRGGIKLILFHRGRKVAIHGMTGELDGERSLTANAGYFALPAAIKAYLVRKMASMADNHEFGFDNTYGFHPQRARGD